MTIHYINRYLLRTLGVLCLMLALGTGQRSYAQNKEQEQLAKLRTFKKEFIAFALLPHSLLKSGASSETLKDFFLALDNPIKAKYEEAHLIYWIGVVQSIVEERSDKQLFLNTFKEVLRSPSKAAIYDIDQMKANNEDTYLGCMLAMAVLHRDILNDEELDRVKGEVILGLGLSKWGINIELFLSLFEQRYTTKLSEEEIGSALGYMYGVFAHDNIKYLRAKGIGISPHDLRQAFDQMRSFDTLIEGQFWIKQIMPDIGARNNRTEAFILPVHLDGFMSQIRKNYRRNVAIPLGIPLP